MRRLTALTRRTEGSAILEFAIVLPLLVVFVVGIYDFSGAFNQKQKIAQAAQQGAITAGAQATSDIDPSIANPDALQSVVAVVFNSLAGSGILTLANQGTCKPIAAAVSPPSGLTWTYSISGCSGYGDTLTITIDRGWVPAGAISPVTVGTKVTVDYPYHWRFNSVIQLLGGSFAAPPDIKESAAVHNQN
jgi:Flp pilus assembly protein TadG